MQEGEFDNNVRYTLKTNGRGPNEVEDTLGIILK